MQSSFQIGTLTIIIIVISFLKSRYFLSALFTTKAQGHCANEIVYGKTMKEKILKRFL